MANLKLIKNNIALAIPILISSIAVMGSAIINARIVGYANPNNWYLLGLYLPVNYLVLGLLESGRVCSIRAINSSSEHKINLSRTLQLTVLFGLIFLLLSLATLGFYELKINIFNVKARLFESFSLFVALYLLSYAIVSANSIFNAALFGISKAKLASALIIFVSLLSILLTYEIAQHLHFSIYTLPLATLAAYTIGSLVAFLKLKQGATKQILFNCMSFRYCLCVIKDSGIPVFLSYLAIPVGIFIINYLLAQFGDNAIAGFSIAFRVQNFLILPAIAIGIASGIILNQVKKPNEANSASLIKHTLTFSILIYLPVSILVFSFNRELVSLFTTDHQVAVVAQKYLANLSLAYITFCPLLSLISIWEQTGSAFKGLSINIGVLTLQILIAGAIAVYTNNLDMFFKVSALIMGVIAFLLITHAFLKTNRQKQSPLKGEPA